MIIMLIFLALSVLLVIATIIYLNRKSKNQNTQNDKNKNDKDVTHRKKHKKKQLADILKVKIKGKIICLGNRYSSIIRLGSIDYNMLSFDEQEAIENVLIQTALSIDYPIQFFTTTEYIDTLKIINQIKSNKFRNENIINYQYNLIKYLEDLMDNRNISIIKNYAIMSFDGTYSSAIDELERRTLLFKNNLLRAKITCEILEETEIYNLIYRELNKNSSLKIENLMKGEQSLYVNKKTKKIKQKEKKSKRK